MKETPLYPDVSLTLPEWVPDVVQDGPVFDTIEDRMRFATALARRNVAEGTGGPFGAAVFDLESGGLVAPGVNRVTALDSSSAHAEIMALSLAQRLRGTYDLAENGARCELVSSTEPCAMCLGAIPWSGVRSLVCGARAEDACAIGLDEGAKPDNWVDALAERGIEVLRDVCREDAAEVLRAYARAGGVIYNGRRDAHPPPSSARS